MANIEEKVEELVIKDIENLGYELYDVQYVKEGKDYFLRIFIDSSEGISLEDCEKVSNQINSKLDEREYIKEQYFLEVSSPGIERILRKDKHLANSINKDIEIRLFKAYEQKKELVGKLISFNKNELTIDENEKNQEIILERKNISQIKLKYNWN